MQMSKNYFIFLAIIVLSMTQALAKKGPHKDFLTKHARSIIACYENSLSLNEAIEMPRGGFSSDAICKYRNSGKTLSIPLWEMKSSNRTIEVELVEKYKTKNEYSAVGDVRFKDNRGRFCHFRMVSHSSLDDHSAIIVAPVSYGSDLSSTIQICNNNLIGHQNREVLNILSSMEMSLNKTYILKKYKKYLVPIEEDQIPRKVEQFFNSLANKEGTQIDYNLEYLYAIEVRGRRVGYILSMFDEPKSSFITYEFITIFGKGGKLLYKQDIAYH